MHAETLAYMFHNFDYEMKQIADAAARANGAREPGEPMD